MALTNAERQARFRTKQQEKLAAAERASRSEDAFVVFGRSYMEGGRNLLENFSSTEIGVAALKEFNRGVTGREMADAMFKAGEAAASKIFERLHFKDHERLNGRVGKKPKRRQTQAALLP